MINIRVTNIFRRNACWLPLFCALAVSGAFLPTSALSTVATVISYQGLLKDASGMPVAGPADLTFAIYTVSAGGTALWTEAHPGTPIASGIFNVSLGSTVSFPSTMFINSSLWLETRVAGDPLTPRSKLGSVPFAFHAAIADSVVSGNYWSINGSDVYRTSGRVGIGTSAPSTTLDVNGIVRSRSGGFRFPDGTTLLSANLANGVSLDQAYTLGHTITANAGAVNIASSGGLTVNGSVGIGTTSSSSKLTVAGVIESTSGGIKFPDGTTQTSATRPRTFVACINFSGTACTVINCSCGTGTLITKIQSDCTVTSETGSCSALSFSCSGGGVGHGSCCVCQP